MARMLKLIILAISFAVIIGCDPGDLQRRSQSKRLEQSAEFSVDAGEPGKID